MDTKPIVIIGFIILLIILGLYFAGRTLNGLETDLKQIQNNKPSPTKMVEKIKEIKIKTEETQKTQKALIEDNDL